MIKLRYTISAFLVGIYFIGSLGSSYAGISMGEVRARFERETGKKWADAEFDERQEFLFSHEEYKAEESSYEDYSEDYSEGGGDEESEYNYYGEGEDLKADFITKERFEKTTGISWASATDEQKKDFLEDVNKRKEKDAKLREKELLRKKKIQQKAEREKQKRVEAIAKQKREQEKVLQRKQKEEERRRREEQKKVRAARKNLEKLRRGRR